MADFRTRHTLRPGICLLALLVAASFGVHRADAQFAGDATIDATRAFDLYVSDRPEDHDPFRDHTRDMREKEATDSLYA
ncbi:MAG TPA: hypothetical protein VMN39_05650, partial [Longimicrobiaceae bacterium]|nr:hypothetical protein [Longimicrobiaceae bacterium]